jgi:hypothetical protein
MAKTGLIRVAGEGRQLALPGMLWPAGVARARETPLYFDEIKPAQANELIGEWGHPLGVCKRPFESRAWGLAIDGVAVAVAMSATTVGATSAGYKRMQVVELARIARHPDHRGILRVMLRLWTQYFAERWDGWDEPVEAAVSYALPKDEDGNENANIYRFDGWKYWGKCKPWSGGATWSNPSKANEMGDGVKRLYYYPFPTAAKSIHALLGKAGFTSGLKPTKRDPGRARPGFRVTSPAPRSVQVRHYSVTRDSAACQLEMLAAYAGAVKAAGYAVTSDYDRGELIITRAPARQAA